MNKKAVYMHLPDGKLPGFYAQIVKELARSVTLFDRDKELLILNGKEDAVRVLQLLEHYKTDAEQLELLLLPADAETGILFEDYGFSSRLEHRYLYAHLTAIFGVEPTGRKDSEPEQALLQMDEYIIARFTQGGNMRYAVDRELTELIERTAQAYGCKAMFAQ
jgi:hypothetical protein